MYKLSHASDTKWKQNKIQPQYQLPLVIPSFASTNIRNLQKTRRNGWKQNKTNRSKHKQSHYRHIPFIFLFHSLKSRWVFDLSLARFSPALFFVQFKYTETLPHRNATVYVTNDYNMKRAPHIENKWRWRRFRANVRMTHVAHNLPLLARFSVDFVWVQRPGSNSSVVFCFDSVAGARGATEAAPWKYKFWVARREHVQAQVMHNIKYSFDTFSTVLPASVNLTELDTPSHSSTDQLQRKAMDRNGSDEFCQQSQ